MKLVEILARQLKEWKRNADGVVFSSKGSACYFFHGNNPAYDDFNWRATQGCFWFVGDNDKVVLDAETPEDHATAIVTRAQWQEALDSLNKPVVEAWNGEGLPPVGTICHCLYKGMDQGEVRVEYIGKNACVLLNLFHGDEQCGMTEYYLFTPIRAPEKIAEQERVAGLNEMIMHMKDHPSGTHGASHLQELMIHEDVARDLWAAGYRKQESL